MALVPREVPLTPNPQTIAISLAGTTYKLTFKWNPRANYWVMDIATANGVPINSGIPLITGADLLAQYEYLGITGEMLVQTDHDTDAVPTFENLGIHGHLYFLSAT
jgi:hypothetical protein